MLNVAEYICDYLAAYSVRFIFGYPGAAILPLMDAIHAHPALEWVLMRDERAAIFAASAQAKLTDKMSVCLVTSGPGATNVVTGLVDADLDHAKVLLITGLINTLKHNLSHFQDIDQVDLLKSCCGVSIACEHPLQIPELLQTAVGFVIKNRRPAHLAIAMNVQTYTFAEKEEISAKKHFLDLQRPIELLTPPSAAIDKVADTISASSNLAIAVGPRARGAGAQIEALSEQLQAPIICSFAAKGIINENHPNYFGILGLFGIPVNLSAFHIIQQTKTLLSFGVDDLVYFLTGEDINQQRELIQCEPEITNISYQFVQKRILLGRLDTIAEELTKRASPCSTSLFDQAKKNRAAVEKKILAPTAPHTVHQQDFLQQLNPYIDHQNMILVFDIGDTTIWGIEVLKLTHYQTTLVSNHIGSMGFCLPAMIAAKLTKPDHMVVGICGDGAAQMMLGEINTAVQLNLNMVLIIFNNGVLQRVVANQTNEYGTTLNNPDFSALAKSCGAIGISIDHTEEIETKLKGAFSINNKLVIIDVRCDPAIFATVIEPIH